MDVDLYDNFFYCLFIWWRRVGNVCYELNGLINSDEIFLFLFVLDFIDYRGVYRLFLRYFDWSFLLGGYDLLLEGDCKGEDFYFLMNDFLNFFVYENVLVEVFFKFELLYLLNKCEFFFIKWIDDLYVVGIFIKYFSELFDLKLKDNNDEFEKFIENGYFV